MSPALQRLSYLCVTGLCILDSSVGRLALEGQNMHMSYTIAVVKILLDRRVVIIASFAPLSSKKACT